MADEEELDQWNDVAKGADDCATAAAELSCRAAEASPDLENLRLWLEEAESALSCARDAFDDIERAEAQEGSE